MRISDIFFGLILFGGGVITGVFLREANVVTGPQIKKAAQKGIDKIKGKREAAPANE